MLIQCTDRYTSAWGEATSTPPAPAASPVAKRCICPVLLHIAGPRGARARCELELIRFCPSMIQMPVCSLFLHQQLSLLQPSQYQSALALPDRAANPAIYDIAIASAGLGVRSVCAIPRMGSVGGFPGSAGNAANIVLCAIGVLVGVFLALKAGKRQAAVARWEIRAFFIIFALQCLFQLLSTGGCRLAASGR